MSRIGQALVMGRTELPVSEDQLRSDLEQLRHGRLSSQEAYHVIHEFGKAGFLQARPDVEALLDSEDPELRYVSLEVLAQHWRLSDHWETARQFLEQDTSSHCRIMGASALKTLKRDSRDAPTLKVLAAVVNAPEEWGTVRQAAYAAMRGVVHFDVHEQFRLAIRDIDLDRDVDWEFIATWS